MNEKKRSDEKKKDTDGKRYEKLVESLFTEDKDGEMREEEPEQE